jgi:hypothetical protein
MALSLQFGKITLQFRKLQGETGWLQTATTATLSACYITILCLSPDYVLGSDPAAAVKGGSGGRLSLTQVKRQRLVCEC